MKNLKKLFASVASVAILASMLPVATLGAASYSDELQGAYDYAYGVGITTQSSIDAANMYGTLTRAHMAKMMVNFAKEVFNQEPDTSKDCVFSDISAQTEEMKGYIEESCQLGLMGQGITAFNPNGAVTRAQFGTVLSRVLRGDENEGGTPYYANHLKALKDAGIMNNISNPMANEIRGYVMLMMERADDNGNTTPEICDTPENQTACSLGLDTCPAECQEDVDNGNQVKAGNLEVSLNKDSLDDGANIPMVGTIKFAAVDFEAGSEDINLNSVEISKVGLSDIPSGTKVRFELDGKRISGRSTFSSEGKAVISFAPVYVVKANSTATLDLYAELSTTAGQDIQFESTTIDTSAEDVSGDFTTPKLRTATYTVAPVAFAVASNGGSFNVVETAMELGAFKVSNNDASSETRDVELQTITLRQNGNGSIDNLSNIVLERNGVVVSKNPSTNGKDITFSIGDTIKDGTTATYYIKAKVTNVDNSAGDTYIFALRQNTDLNAVEIKNGFRSTVTGYTTLNTYTINGGDIRFTKDSATELSANYAAGSEDVILMKGTINVKAPVTLEDVTITGNNTGLSNLFTTIYLKIGSSTFSYSPASGEKVAKFYGSVTVNSTSTVTMYGKLKDNAPAADVKFEDLKLSSFARAEYVSTSNTVSSGVGSIAGVNVTVQLSKLNVTRNDGLGNTSIALGTKGYNAYGIKLTSDQGNGVTVSNAIFAVSSTNTGKLYSNADLTLYVNGKAVQTKTINGATVSFDSFSLSVDKSTAGTLELKADLTDAFDTGTLQLTLSSLNVVDTLTSKDVTVYAKPVGALLSVLAADATIAASDNNPQAQLFLSPSVAQKLFAFKVTAKNDDVRLYNVKLTGVNLDGLSNFVIVDSANTKIADVTTSSGTAVEFTQIANAPKILKDKSETYYVVADVNTNTTLASVNVTLTNVDIKGTNGGIVNKTSTLASKTHGTSENTMVVAKAANSSKDIASSALRFTVTASGKDSVVLTGLKLTTQLSAYTGYTNVEVYKDSINSSNLAFTGTIGSNQTLNPVLANAKNTVDAGSTVTYIVIIPNAIGDGTSGVKDWSISLNDVIFSNTLHANLFNNVGSFPMTEVK